MFLFIDIHRFSWSQIFIEKRQRHRYLFYEPKYTKFLANLARYRVISRFKFRKTYTSAYSRRNDRSTIKGINRAGIDPGDQGRETAGKPPVRSSSVYPPCAARGARGGASIAIESSNYPEALREGARVRPRRGTKKGREGKKKKMRKGRNDTRTVDTAAAAAARSS